MSDEEPRPPRVAAALPSLARTGVAPGALIAAGFIEALTTPLALPEFRLAGGTALAWHLGHRISEDLDFFCFHPGALNPNTKAALADACARHPHFVRSDLSFAGTVHAVFQTGDHKTQVSWFEVTSMRWVSSPHPTAAGFSVAGLADVGAMKLTAIGGRSTKKDFYDLVALERAGLDLRALWPYALRVVPDLADPAARQHLVHALTDFGPASTDPDPVSLNGTTWEQAQSVARRAAAMLASEYGQLPPPSL